MFRVCHAYCAVGDKMKLFCYNLTDNRVAIRGSLTYFALPTYHCLHPVSTYTMQNTYIMSENTIR
jgi:hypothetical protein